MGEYSETHNGESAQDYYIYKVIENNLNYYYLKEEIKNKRRN